MSRAGDEAQALRQLRLDLMGSLLWRIARARSEFPRDDDVLAAIEEWAHERLDDHGCSIYSDAFGGYLCLCGKASFSEKYGCIVTGLFE